MKLIVGLGNPGKKYQETRHNVGFMVVDRFAQEENGEWETNRKFNADLCRLNPDLLLVKPQTMMNASGFAVGKIFSYFGMESLKDIWVIHDDLDLPIGRIKIRVGGGTAGHHGLDSLIEGLGGSDFVRFRLGIGHPGKTGKWEVGTGRMVSEKAAHKDVEEYVLENFERKDRVEAEKVIEKVAKALKFGLEKGVEEAMNKFNLK